MDFQQTITSFGPMRKHTVFHAARQDSFTFVPEHGATLLSIVLDGEEILDGYTSPTEVQADRWSKSRLLYPFPNRLRDGSYEWEGKTYEFPRNDDKRNNALHGFSSDRLFTVEDAASADQTGQLTAVYRYTGDEAYYPFPFDLRVTYHLAEAHTFALTMALINTGHTVMPVGLGWHPYFRLSDRINNTELQLPPVELIGVDARMIPTGKRYDYATFAELRPIGEEILDNGFALTQPSGPYEVRLQATNKTLVYRQTTGERGGSFLQVFTPPDRQSIALEPMTCNIDAFHNEDGLVALTPGDTLSARVEVQLRKG